MTPHGDTAYPAAPQFSHHKLRRVLHDAILDGFANYHTAADGLDIDPAELQVFAAVMEQRAQVAAAQALARFFGATP
jgi:hypothetical protein